MTKRTFFMALTATCFIAGISMAGEPAPEKVVALSKAELAKYSEDPVIIKAVNDENAKGKTLEQIKQTDGLWQKHAGIADNMKALMDSERGVYLRAIQSKAGYFSEIFVMDNQGSNVAMTDKTSDYWQGDEAKFQKSFNNGSGAVFIDEVKYDDSSQAYIVQVSVPVMDAGKAIGAITFGIDVDKAP